MTVVKPSRPTSAEELRATVEFDKLIAKEDLNTDGVDYEKLAHEISTAERPSSWDPPRILPPIWEETERNSDEGSAMYVCRSRKLKAIVSCNIERDGRAWIHLSVSSKNRVPNWDELAEAKRVFLGDREAYQVLPPKVRYVNINARVLHMFALFDEKETALPDFTRGTGSL